MPRRSTISRRSPLALGAAVLPTTIVLLHLFLGGCAFPSVPIISRTACCERSRSTRAFVRASPPRKSSSFPSSALWAKAPAKTKAAAAKTTIKRAQNAKNDSKTTKRAQNTKSKPKSKAKTGKSKSDDATAHNKQPAKADGNSRRWEDKFQRLAAHYQRTGNANVPQHYKDEDGTNLGTWLNFQRQKRRNGKLKPEEEARLDSIGVVWDFGTSGHDWEKYFALLEAYQRETGDCNVPRRHEVTVTTGDKAKTFRLGEWLDKQRTFRRNGSLEATRVTRLSDLGLVWNLRTHKWDEMYGRLVEFRETMGHCNVPKDFRTNDNYKGLGAWVDTQRLKKRQGILDAARQERLEALGIEWNPREREWHDMLDLLVRYQRREGHCMVPSKHVEDGRKLGHWVSHQRHSRDYQPGNARYEKLHAIGFYDVLPLGWDEMVARLVRYRERNGDCRVPVNHVEDGKGLGLWLRNQRNFKRQGTLNPSRMAQLEDLGVVWEPREHDWDEMLSLLAKYRDREGDCMVVQNHQEGGKNLGIWLRTQRESVRLGTLDPSQKERLEALGVVWDPLAFEREEMVSRLLRYRDREGDCNVPKAHVEDDKPLGTWLANHRRLKVTGKLDPEFQKRLESVGVVWSVRAQRWEAMFALLEHFRNREGHCRVPQRHTEYGQRLGAWLDQQRTKKKNGTLDGTLQARLEGLGVEWEIYGKWGFDDDMDHLFDDEDMYA